MSRPNTKRVIVEAAIRLFLRDGYRATSIAGIREESGATTGSIYHFFGRKAGIAIAIWEDAIAEWEKRTRLRTVDGNARLQMEASLRGFLEWARENPDHFRVYDEILGLSRTSPEFGAIRERIAAGHAASQEVYGGWVASGAVRDLPWPLARAILMGPGLEYLRSGQTPDEDAVSMLVEAAWLSIAA